ncbi:hypothetical protein [Moorella sp. Hama-1]|uniref:hypothetical protein n=1 Tax=Moorella sp. Hama-1 TaxID=2138101 RepID=UPI000D657C57|nr:hypothetical protein [Moorella sp. Hama-1]MDN5362793.1 hypothetical protein [Moorella sp. (in: firmicutes)]BCV22831.1 hypothetical protein hamaS1_29000 [Moorella sp. Hama-1]
MSLNGLIRQSLGMVEELVAMPFEVARKVWPEESNSTASQVIHRAAGLGEGLATMPVKAFRELFEDEQQQQPPAS